MKKQDAQQVLQQLINTAVKAGLFGDAASVVKAQEALELLSYKASEVAMEQWKKNVDEMIPQFKTKSY